MASQRPEFFNFAVNVIDYWAAQPGNLQAMQWVSQDESCTKTMSFEYFARQSHRIAVLFEQWGLKEGDTMIMILPRVPAWWEIAIGALRSGIVLSPATTLCTEKDIQYRCVKSAAKVFIGDAVSVAKFLSIQQVCPTVEKVIQVGDGPSNQAISLYSSLETISADAKFQAMQRHWSRPALIYFTSGTSGPPKMVGHNQISYPLANVNTGKYWYQLAPGRVLWNTAEQGWGKAAWSFFAAWNCGASLFVYDDRQAFRPQRTIDILHRYPITTLCAAPLVFRHLVSTQTQEHFKQNRPKALVHCTAAGEALDAEVTRRWQQMTGLEIHEGYGQTETILLCGNLKGSIIRPGSMGKPAPGVPLHVITSTGADTADGEEGDMAVLLSAGKDKSDFFGIFDGYVESGTTVHREEKTYTTNGEVKTWYLTGDKAYRDEDGYIWFVGRADDVINTSGYRIGPFEVESTLNMHPAVAESVIVSSPDDTRGEVVKAFVVLTAEFKDADQNNLREQLQGFCKKYAAPYKYPRKIEFVTRGFLPRTSSGKIQRAILKKIEWRNRVKARL
ncbi:hypothetical protein C7974DRAFT_326729 [Boeremia exigua]|uniref:uncharacterized protein n=1 Tax=Boeremia exigua TaxID=749465 RepID=UPI001E8D9BA4|nr:uncharacterized protein C7974DRAFT_326729 [Boeremia exigua]KAH6641944.1 hypothetical protein C7974DRAFT_326729 [Boeremia exigua]